VNNIAAFYEELSNVNDRSINTSKYRMMFSVSRLRIKTRTNNISEKVEYTKGVIRSRRSRDRQYNGHKKKDKRKI
jgi:hypothetical protein